MAKQRAASRQRQLQRWSPRPPQPGGASSLPALPQLPYPAAWALGAAARGMLRLGYAVSDHHRNALILAVFGFKVGAWGTWCAGLDYSKKYMFPQVVSTCLYRPYCANSVIPTRLLD